MIGFYGLYTPTASAGIYSFIADDIDGNLVELSSYSGKVLLIVNTASKCGFTPQYEGLEELYRQYHDRGFEILAFPSNDFRGQEPGTNAQIKEFCKLTYGVKFPLFSKITVKGNNIHPLYQYLTQESPFPGAISWNFNKFLINRQGEVIARFESRTTPLSPEMTGQIEKLL
ncbi:MAG: glutathione peroxidase [Candidatus Omnitrophica bacterium]|nr:glutathione peroxidase [Candidatus Omnitrophota bacterium]